MDKQLKCAIWTISWIVLGLLLLLLSNKVFASPLDLIDKFHKKPTIEKPSDINKPPEAPERLDHHLFLYHTPTAMHSIRSYQKRNETFLNVNLQFTAFEYDKIKSLKSYTEGLSLLDPIVNIGMSKAIRKKDQYFYVGIVTGIKRTKHGFMIKATLYSKTYKNLFQSTVGRVGAYFYKDGEGFVSSKDIVSFYLGWTSPTGHINLSDLQQFRKDFNDRKVNSENLIFGIFYLPNVLKKVSFNLEMGFDHATFGVNYLL